jgi:hypothetical protein
MCAGLDCDTQILNYLVSILLYMVLIECRTNFKRGYGGKGSELRARPSLETVS